MSEHKKPFSYDLIPPGTSVFFIHNNRVTEFKIGFIYVEIWEDKTRVTYKTCYLNGNWAFDCGEDHNYYFSREALIASL